MENAYIIKGGKPLKGDVQLSGAKNVALKTIIASLLFEGDVVLKNVPRINDVTELLHLIKKLGGKVNFTDTNTLVLNADNLKSNKVDMLHGSKIRTSFMMFAPLLYKFKKAYIPNPGGCRLGARSIDRVIDGMTALGITTAYDSSTGYYYSEMKSLPHGFYRFQKPSHTGTELLIMIGLLSNEEIVIENAALEPEIDDLIQMLNEGGADIKRDGEKIMVKKNHVLKQTKPYQIMTDRNEAMTYAVAGIATKGDVTVIGIERYLLDGFIEKLVEAGGGYDQRDALHHRFYYKGPLKSVSIVTGPYPGFMTDWQPLWAVLMTQSQGETDIHERVFENRFSFVDELKKLGANIKFINIPVSNPSEFYFFNYKVGQQYHQAIRIYGSQALHNGVMQIADMRAGATLAIAALMTEGESVIHGASNVERGYEDFVGKVKKLGGTIRKI